MALIKGYETVNGRFNRVKRGELKEKAPHRLVKGF